MADSSSHSLLATYGDSGKAKHARKGKRSTIKTPLFVLFLAAILIGCIVAIISILLTSHEDPVKSWKVQPSVWLSFLSGIYAVALSGLFFAGVAVTWWRSIGHGTTLKRLHYISAGANPKDFLPAFLAGGHARRVAIVALVVFFAKIAVGPLTQRATRPRNRDIERAIDLSIPMVKEIPDGYFGTWTSLYYEGIANAQDTIFGHNVTNIRDDGSFCPEKGTCSASIWGAGLSHTCTSDTRTLDLRDENNVGSTVFSVRFDMNEDFDQPMLELEVEYISSIDDSCTATVTTDSCFLIPATIWYPVIVDNRTLLMNATEVVSNLTIVNNYTSAADVEPSDDVPRDSTSSGPLRGIILGLSDYLQAKSLLTNSDGVLGFTPSIEPRLSPAWAMMFAKSPISSDRSSQQCDLEFHSPTNGTLSMFYSYMFRAAYYASFWQSDPEQNIQTFTASFEGVQLQYITDFGWLAASVVVMVIGTLAAMSLLWGWWQVKRHVTLSPLETGKAFGAPILLGAGPEQEAKGIIKEIGHERVAHDGDELIWNGTVYTTATSTTLVGSKAGMREMDGLLSPNNMQNVSRRGHRRGMSSVSEMGSGSNTPAFEHGIGHSTRVWHEDEEHDVGMANYNAARKRSGSASSDQDPSVKMPLILTPGREGVPELPPIPPSGAIRMDAFGPSSPLPKSSPRSGSPLATPPPADTIGMAVVPPTSLRPTSRSATASPMASPPLEPPSSGALVPLKTRSRANSGSAIMSPIETITMEAIRGPSPPPPGSPRPRASSGSSLASPPPNEVISMGAFGPSNPHTRIRSRSGSGDGMPSPYPAISAGNRRASQSAESLPSPSPIVAAGNRRGSGSGTGNGGALLSPPPLLAAQGRRRSGSGSAGLKSPPPANGNGNVNAGLKRNLSLIEEISNRAPE